MKKLLAILLLLSGICYADTFSGGVFSGLTMLSAGLNDNFVDSNATSLENHISDSSHTWSKFSVLAQDQQTIAIQSNRTYVDAALAGGTYISSVAIVSPNYRVIAKFRQVSRTGSTVSACVMCRSNMETNSWGTNYAACYDDANGQWTLSKYTTYATSTSLGTWSETLTAGMERIITLECYDAAKKVYIDGTERISSNNNDITISGKVVMRQAYGSLSTGTHIDYIYTEWEN